MSQTNTRWSVVTVAREEPEVIQRFVAWHLSQGAHQITIFFDDPNDVSIDMLAHLDQVLAVPCTEDFWAGLGETANSRFTRRQNKAAKFGYSQMPDGWVLNIDADELIYVEGRRLGDILQQMPDTVRSVLVAPAERVLMNGDEAQAAFRQKMPRELVQDVYGETYFPVMVRNRGMVGHLIGKSILRTGNEAYRFRQHFMEDRSGQAIIDHELDRSDGAYLLHFFNRGYDDWRRKLDYRLLQGGFRHRMRAMLQALVDAGDEDGLKAVFGRLHHIDDRQCGILSRNNLLVVPEIDTDAIIARYF